MTGTQSLVARGLLGAAAAVASVLLTRSGRLRDLPVEAFDRAIAAAMAVSRLGLFVLIFFVLHITPRGDIPSYYLPQALEVLQHHLPYRDFLSSYAPLHPYLDAVFARLSATPLSIMFFAVLTELCLLPLWLRLGRHLLPEGQLRIAALLYLASPISLQFVVVDGQDNVAIAVLLALALLWSHRGRPVLSGLAFSASIAVIKFLPLLYAPAFFFGLPRRWRWAAGAASLLAVVYGAAVWMHLPILQPLTVEGDIRSAGNLPYVLEAVSGSTLPNRLCDLTLLVALAATSILVARACLRASVETRLRVLTFGMAALTLTLVLLAKKCWPPYLMLCLFPLGLIVSGEVARSRWLIALFAGFGWVAVTEHSVWGVFENIDSASLHLRLLSGEWKVLLFFGLELLLLAGYAWLLAASVQRLRRETRLPA